MRSRIYVIIIYILFAILVASCSGDNHRYRIGVSQCSDDEWRRRMNEEMRRELLFHDDAEIEIRSADDNNEKQIADIKYFMDNDFDAIIAAPNEADAITPVIKDAYDKGIPVIIFDRNINGNSYTSYIELDNEGLGRAAAEYAGHLAALRPVNILEIRGLDGSTPALERHRGFVNEIRNSGNLKITHSVAGDWNGDKAGRLVDSILREDKNIDIIYAHNDVMAIAASSAVKSAGLQHIKILGTDAAPSLGIKAVRDSVIDATFIYPTEGGRAIRLAMSILRGENYPRRDYIPALSPVDSSNAEILIRQDALLRDETAKIAMLKSKNNLIKERQESQTWFLYAATFAAVVLTASLFMALRFISQRKRYNEILKDKNKELKIEHDRQVELYKQLDDATKSKLAFFTNVSHDLRTPLTLIAGPVARLASASYLKEDDRSLMKMADKNVGILRRLIDQILDFRRYQNGKSELNLVEIDPIPILSEWCDAFRDAAINRNLRFETELSDSKGLTMALDIEKLERVVFNLISNAFKFTLPGGEVKIRAQISQSDLSIRVVDSGVGIPLEEREMIFNRFYRSDKVNPNGSGIGLALSKAFVELMNGSITLESEPGFGSKFSVSIPVTHVDFKEEDKNNLNLQSQIATSELMSEDSVENEFSESKPLILIIDDNPDILNLMTGLLGEEYNVMCASDGRTGMRLSMKYVPDLVICDLMMPVMDGLQFTEKLKDERSTSHIPVLMLTACKLDEQRLQSYDSGADSFISKPFNNEVLLSRVKNLLLNRKRIKNLYLETREDDKMLLRKDIPDSNDRYEVESDFYRHFIHIVRKRFEDPSLSLIDIAAEIGLGSTQLARKIKALTGLSPVDIIKNYRLKEAKRLVITTEKTISEIAYAVGFSSPAYLSKCFKDTFGCSPTEIRSDS